MAALVPGLEQELQALRDSQPDLGALREIESERIEEMAEVEQENTRLRTMLRDAQRNCDLLQHQLSQSQPKPLSGNLVAELKCSWDDLTGGHHERTRAQVPVSVVSTEVIGSRGCGVSVPRTSPSM